MSEFPLDSPPVCRRFLAGGPGGLRLTLPAAAVVAGGGLMLLPISAAISDFGGTAEAARRWPPVVAATIAALLVAALTARWLGSGLGTLAGLLQLTSTQVLLAGPGDLAEMLFCTLVVATMGIFAVANVPGRLPLIDRRWPSRAFYAGVGAAMLLAGPIGPAFILAGCLLFVILCGDSRGLRFFADPAGVAVFVLLAALRLAYPEELQGIFTPLSCFLSDALGPPRSLSEVLHSMAVKTLPWTPLAALAMVVGLRQGHYATPIWRFLGCWLLGPLALMAAAGTFRHEPYLAALLPPSAVMAAAGLTGVFAWRRRGPRIGGRRPVEKPRATASQRPCR